MAFLITTYLMMEDKNFNNLNKIGKVKKKHLSLFSPFPFLSLSF